jgi:carbon-monoxide dehydrogenase large subunit
MGAEVKRKEDPRLITGTSTYVGDLNIPGLHYVAFVRSPHAHANVGGIDTSAAMKRPGVFKVVTGEDLRACQPIPPGGPSAEGGGGAATSLGRRHYPLSIGQVRYVGEPVAAVIATSESAAVDGAADVVVTWEPLPAVADQFAAMEPGAPQLFDDAPKNIEHETPIKVGGPDAAFAKAHKVVNQRMVSQRLCGVPMEPRAALAMPDPTSGGLTLWSTTQAPHVLRNDIATCLGLEQNLVRVIAPEVGGGFGVKFGI